MKKNKKPNGYWTKEKCIIESKKYSSKIEWRKKSGGSYKVALKHKWMEECCKHMIVLWEKKWTKELCLKQGEKYKSRCEWRKNSSYSYFLAINNNWIKKNKIITKAECAEEAKKYNYRNEFNKKSSKYYNKAQRNKWLDEICQHMIPLGHKYKRIVYVYEFPDNHVYVGLTCNEEQRQKSHLKRNDSAVFLYIKKTNLNPLYKRITPNYIDVYKAQIIEKETINIYKQHGWNIINRTKAGSLGSAMIQPQQTDCINDAKNYKSRTEWSNNSYLYQIARKNKWLDICCKHMQTIVKHRNYWTKEKCIDSAKNYQTKMSWQKSEPSAYSIAHKNNWINECSVHMIKATNYSTKKKKVIQFSMYGEKINEFDSISEAEKKTKISNSHISSCCKNKRRYAGGFIWQYKNEKITNMLENNKDDFKKYIKIITMDKIKKPVIQFDLNNNFIKEFESLSDAYRNTNISMTQIKNCCLNKQKEAGEYIWKFKNVDLSY